jgi:hypothetical protein
MTQKAKQMCWLPYKGNQLRMMLHLREYAHQPWKVYTASPHAVPDYKIPKGSKGWATFQKLRKIGWTLISKEQAKSSIPLMMISSQRKRA